MIRVLTTILLVICFAVLWSVLVTWRGWSGVMAQPFIVDSDLKSPHEPIFDKTFGLFPRTNLEPLQLTIPIDVPYKPGGDRRCRLIYKWPKNYGESFKVVDERTDNQGMPWVGNDDPQNKSNSMFYAEGLERQIRIVRKAFVAQWVLKVKTPTDDCGDWGVTKRDNPDAWQAQIEDVADTAAARIAEIARLRFDEIGRQAWWAFALWAVAIPLAIVIGGLLAFAFVAALGGDSGRGRERP